MITSTHISRIKRAMRLEHGFDLDAFAYISVARPCPCKACDDPFKATTVFAQTHSGKGIVFCEHHGELMNSEIDRKGEKQYGIA